MTTDLRVFPFPIDADGAEAVEKVGRSLPEPRRGNGGDDVDAIYTSPDLPTASDAGWRAIERANRPEWLFQKGGIPVRLGSDDEARTRLETLNLDKFRYVVARVAPWKTKTKNKKTGEIQETAAKPPKDVIADMLAYPSDRMPLPIVSRITDVPTVAFDGMICDRPGYNPANKTYYAPAAGLVIPEFPEYPIEEDIRRAVQTIVEPFADFSFKGDADLAHLVSLAILPFARDLICGPTPFHLADAPIHGSGKTLSFQTALYPGTGGNYGPMAQTTEEELRKKITTEILAGRPIVFLDNISREIDSSNLSMAITSPYWFDRVLGKQVDVTLPMRLIFVGTGNNVILSGEIARRTVRVRIDPNTDEPWRREGFRIPNLRGWVHEHRGELVAAILTLIRAWVLDGKPAWPGRALGSFEEWSRVLGGILERAGIGGFLENLDELYEPADLEGATWKTFVTAWWEAHKTAAVGTADLFPIAEKIDTLDLGKGTTDKSQRTVLGKKLWAKKNRVVAGYKITLGTKAHRLNQWHLIPTSGGVR